MSDQNRHEHSVSFESRTMLETLLSQLQLEPFELAEGHAKFVEGFGNELLDPKGMKHEFRRFFLGKPFILPKGTGVLTEKMRLSKTEALEIKPGYDLFVRRFDQVMRALTGELRNSIGIMVNWMNGLSDKSLPLIEATLKQLRQSIQRVQSQNDTIRFLLVVMEPYSDQVPEKVKQGEPFFLPPTEGEDEAIEQPLEQRPRELLESYIQAFIDLQADVKRTLPKAVKVLGELEGKGS